MNNKELRQAVDNYLKNYFNGKGKYDKKIYEAMEYSLNAGGKRVRPLLLMSSYGIYHDNYKDVIEVAAAIEMIHTYSLIHDDLPCMDNDDLRRGKPTNHKVFGYSMALLAGDGLLNEAMDIMFEYCLEKDKKALEACSLISRAASSEGMIGGQVVDILSEGKKVSADELRYMHKKKTGALIKASILSGAILGDAPHSHVELLSQYGDKIGLAFQIEDDILDVIGDTKIMGKKSKSDIENDKCTYVTTYGIDKCKTMCKSLTEECLDIVSTIDGNTTCLTEITELLLKRKR
ncbi:MULTISPECIES: polyprenyl synthetase family protein [Clostridium]|uniref:polyprenyl synthetase family protein n=1 Tax=Clostridium TaxID=1485 RepID=UPI00082500F9|nr:MULTISPECIES: farnesyl diphosphate synthase [Clostridium]PJI09941.1 polyprenyl synthetase family protein [Clostridium sp. CT7]